jgi:uncharacterized RDD family membrane protein YckC
MDSATPKTHSNTLHGETVFISYADFRTRVWGFIIDTVLLCIVSWGFFNVIYFIGMWTWKGQTLGQIVAKVQVVRIDGKPMDLRTSTLRFLGYLACFLTLGIGFLMIVFDSEKQGLHDKIAGTYVIPQKD